MIATARDRGDGMRGTRFAELSAFVAVAEHRNFTKAAAHLGISPSTLSQTVRSFEDRLGVRLLNRTTRSVALTDAGERLLTDAQPVLDGVDKAIESVNSFRDKPIGTLRLTMPRAAAIGIIGPLLPEFLAKFPEVKLEIDVDDTHSDIVSGRFDAGVRIGERIAKVNANYQKKFREPLMMQNQYPQVFNLSSTEDRLNAFFTFGNEQQPVADSDIPLNVPQNDVLFQIHQSAVNNFTATAFAGKIFDEEKIAEYAKDPGSPFYFFAGLLSRNAEEKPLIVKFAEENPIDVSFSGNTIKAVIRADAFAQDGKQHPGLEVTLSYSVKKEGTKIILEQTAAPVVGSREGRRVGASQTVIQTIVKRRLAKLETRRVLQELEPKGEWEGKGKLVPAFADSQNGWFALSYNWVEK